MAVSAVEADPFKSTKGAVPNILLLLLLHCFVVNTCINHHNVATLKQTLYKSLSYESTSDVVS